ncbi:MAG: BMC domain-containing protein [Eubacteriales bacterium]|jgi:ethanolamine utilization microcompartment shell protein EutS|nr:BMC domain-containing protein [Eubacteriales bacterium]
MDLRIIRSPSKGTLDLIKRRMGIMKDTPMDHAEAIGLVQGKMIDMVCAADIAEKTSDVDAYDVRGICPQHMTMIAIFGDTGAVEAALREIDRKTKEGMYSDYSQAYR